MHRLAAGLAAALGAALVTSPAAVDATVARSSGFASKKGAIAPETPHEDDPPLLGTLVQTHTDERVPLDERSPTADRFARLLADRVTGERRELDPKLLELIRSIARKHPGARFELVSGYRSPKLNEMLRKKGRRVASQSQHSLGHAVDFRVVVDPETRGVDPRVLEREIRELGWVGGVGVYTLSSDWFVHADVGRLRRWGG
ncbi:MAG: DUF882 domain-containing protein [Labilithrix sp.]|nr:DUF882 domain-containing protein [Labilithrix sp.]MCW5831371.1 DUF882 domain-containing protein [Labilithrix sp.]